MNFVKTLPLLLGLAVATRPATAQSLYLTRHAQLSFFSETPVENISAKSIAGMSAINTKTNSLYFKVDNTSFEFPKKLMQEHFNENYIESAKYPFSEFTGSFTNPTGADWSTKDGRYPVTVTGKLKLHGVERAYTAQGFVTVRDHKLQVASTFNIYLKDHNIAIPTLVLAMISDQVKVSVSGEYALSQ